MNTEFVFDSKWKNASENKIACRSFLTSTHCLRLASLGGFVYFILKKETSIRDFLLSHIVFLSRCDHYLTKSFIYYLTICQFINIANNNIEYSEEKNLKEANEEENWEEANREEGRFPSRLPKQGNKKRYG